MKDSLWSIDLFRCEFIRLKSMGTGGDGSGHPPPDRNHSSWVSWPNGLNYEFETHR